MNPDKLFDYLDGKLSPADRSALEDKLMSDAQLRKEFAIAREIHRSGRDEREVIMPIDDPEAVARGGRLGRQILTAAFILVMLNVVGGIVLVSWKGKRPEHAPKKEAAVRRQLEDSLGAAGRNAFPAPSLADDEINLTMPRSEWETLAKSVIAAAEACGGSASREDGENEIVLTALIPRERVGDFRKQVLGPTASASPGESAIATVQVRIAEPAQ
jgi:hypothetical protein